MLTGDKLAGTLSLSEPAAFLRMHPEEVRRRAKMGAIPAAKPGRSWIFIEEDLAEHVRSLYASPRQALRVTPRKEFTSCHSENAATPGGSTSLPPTDNEYVKLLGLETKPWRRSTTTS